MLIRRFQTGSKICFLSVFIIVFLFLNSCEKEKPVLEIGLIADPQYANQPTKGKRFYRESLWKLEQAIDTFNYYKVGVVQTLGDVIDTDIRSLEAILPIYNKLNADIENYQLLGNHEFWIDSALVKELPQRLGMPNNYYSYINKNWRFIVLDANEYSNYSKGFYKSSKKEIDDYRENTKSIANRKNWNGAMGSQQQAWLKNELKEATTLKQKVILFSHMPLLPKNNIHNLWNNYEIQHILESHTNVVAFINGHNHEGAYVLKNGIHYLTLFAMVDTPIASYGVLKIYDDYLFLKGFGHQKNIKMDFKP